MFDEKTAVQPYSTRQSSAAKGIMGVRPHMRMKCPT
jgi:hypothetical protein